MRFASADKPVLFPNKDIIKEDDNRSKYCRRGLIACFSGILMLFFMVGPLWGASKKATGTKKVRLFGTVEFRGSLKVLPQWIRVMKIAQQQIKTYSECTGETCSPVALSWKKILQEAQGKPPMEQLKKVNRFFNQWPYRLDAELFGMPDYWTDPGTFMKLSGDCEDYSIAKYYALKELGFDIHNMRIVVIKDRIRNIGHAVLAVYFDQTAYILDNLSDLVMDHKKFAHYIPQYSVNEKYRWAHVMPIGDF
jgi:predicted transglutaminase-like cysteine proteinase